MAWNDYIEVQYRIVTDPKRPWKTWADKKTDDPQMVKALVNEVRKAAYTTFGDTEIRVIHTTISRILLEQTLMKGRQLK